MLTSYNPVVHVAAVTGVVVLAVPTLLQILWLLVFALVVVVVARRPPAWSPENDPRGVDR